MSYFYTRYTYTGSLYALYVVGRVTDEGRAEKMDEESYAPFHHGKSSVGVGASSHGGYGHNS